MNIQKQYNTVETAYNQPDLLLNWLDKTLKDVKEIWAIDLHTGLGPSGYDTLLVSEGMTVDDYNHFESLFPGHIESLDPNAGLVTKS